MNLDNVRVWDMDDRVDYATILRKLNPRNSMMEVFPRTEAYESDEAVAAGLEPMSNVPSVLIPPNEIEEAIRHSHEQQTMPVYHAQDTWRPEGFQWNQDGLGYCWTWGGTAAIMTLRAVYGLATVKLAPVSMGYLVGCSAVFSSPG